MARAKKLDAETATPVQLTQAAAKKAFAKALTSPTLDNLKDASDTLLAYRKAIAAEFAK